jgi:hypothetical protein
MSISVNKEKFKHTLIAAFLLLSFGLSFFLGVLSPLTICVVEDIDVEWLPKSNKAYWLLDRWSIEEETLFFTEPSEADKYSRYLGYLSWPDDLSYVVCNYQPIYIEKEDRLTIDTYIINPSYQKLSLYDIRDGRDFSEKDYEYNIEEYIPVIIGNDLAKEISIGDAIQGVYFCTDVTFIVIGILEEKSDLFVLDSKVEADTKIIVPLFNYDMQDDRSSFFHKAMLQNALSGLIIVNNTDSFEMVYKRIVELERQLQIGSFQFGRVDPLSQFIIRTRAQIPSSVLLFIAVLFFPVRYLIIGIGFSKSSKNKCTLHIVLFCCSIFDTIVFILIKKAYCVPDFSTLSGAGYLILNAVACILIWLGLFIWRRKNEK